MTTGKTIIDPESYYDMQADRSWGATKLHYMDLKGEVLKYKVGVVPCKCSRKIPKNLLN